MDSENFSEAGMEDLLKSPEAFGAPTFEQFSKNREKFMGRDDDKLTAVDVGSKVLGKVAKKMIYELEGFRCKTLEEVEKVAREQGIPLKQLDYRAQLIPLGGGHADILVKFMTKDEFNLRGNINEQK